MTRTVSCFVIEEYQKAYYKKVVEKIAIIVSYSERSSFDLFLCLDKLYQFLYVNSLTGAICSCIYYGL